MKKFPIAAAALLFGTSAYAMLPSTEPSGAWVEKDPYTVQPTAAVAPAYDKTFVLQPAAVESWSKAEPVAWSAEKTDADLKTVAMTDGDMDAEALAQTADKDVTDLDSDVDVAAKEDEGAPMLESAIAEPVATETTVVDDELVPVENGVGGPYEPTAMAAADPAPRPAAQNYPACRPGRGDDNCIQLYERGVRQQLASWNRPTGGFAGSGETQVAMGGPYEPAADSATETERLNQQALAESSVALQNAQMAAASTNAEAAVGGPYEPVDSAMADDAAISGDSEVDSAMGEVANDEAEV